MRVDIRLTNKQRHKLRLLLRDLPKPIPRRRIELHGGLVDWIVHRYLARHKIRVCGAHRCDNEFIYRLGSPGRPKVYCSNACRVAQQYHIKKGD